MPLTTLATNSIGNGTRYTSNADDTDYIVLQDVIVASQDGGQGFNLTGNNNDVEVRGTVSAYYPIILGNLTNNVGQHLHVTATGVLIGEGVGANLYGSFRVENEGEIRGFTHGFILDVGTTSTARIVNDGLIQGYDVGLLVEGVIGGAVTLINDGTIQGGRVGYYGSGHLDKITNTGLMIGDVSLGEAGDYFDNRGGEVRGTVFGDLGNDRFVPGSLAETFSGGGGTDTLIFASNEGARVSLADADGSSNTGWAKGDAYTSVERVTGSNGGNDVLIGNSVNNVLSGRGGNDILNGGTGTDRLEGGTGNDTYVLAVAGDRIVEGAGGGIDTVNAGASLTLAVQVENLVLTGTAAINGTGNTSANRITGNGAANILSGLDGNDALLGGAGNDSLRGGSGADVLTGGRGADALIGGTGSDNFVFNAAVESGLGTQRDTITSFAKGYDDIALSVIDANTTMAGNQAFKLDAGGAFVAGEIRQIRSGSDLRIELNTDGDAAAEMSILLNDVKGQLGASDFLF